MRVTKTIKEYITEQVKAKFPITEEEKSLKEKLEEIDDKAEQIEKQVRKYAVDLCKTANKDFKIDHWDELDNIYIYTCRIVSGSNNPYEKELRILRSKRNEKINKKVKDIIVTLELGGTKADLDKMLAEVGE